jgi:hypothetical protein
MDSPMPDTGTGTVETKSETKKFSRKKGPRNPHEKRVHEILTTRVRVFLPAKSSREIPVLVPVVVVAAYTTSHTHTPILIPPVVAVD